MFRQAFHQRLTTYLRSEQDRLYRLAYSYTQNEQDALDVVQTAIVKALSAADMREPRYLRTWVYRIVVNTALDCLRARRRLVLSDDELWQGEDEAEDPPRAADLDVHDALNRLPADLKTVIILRYFYQFQLQEVADVLDMNLSTVKTRLYRALRLLKVEMEGEYA